MVNSYLLLLLISARPPGFEMEYFDKCYPNEDAETCSRRQERWRGAMEQYKKEVAEEAARELEYLKKDLFVVEAEEGREKVGALAPKWCKGATAPADGDLSGLRRMPSSVRNFVDQRFFSFSSLILAAEAACIVPDNEDVKKQAGYLVQAMVNVVGFSAEEAIADLTARLDEDGLKKAKAELCGELKVSEEADGDVKAMGNANWLLFGCDRSDLDGALWTNSSGVDSDPTVYYLDSTLQPESELLRLAWLLSATRAWDTLTERPHQAMQYAMIQIDLPAFDPAKVKKQVQANPFGGNVWAQIVISESLGALKRQSAHYEKAIAKLLKDEGWREILVEAPKKAVKDWTTRADKFKSALEHSRDFEKKAFAPSLKTAKGCSPTLRTDFHAYLKTISAAPSEFTQTVVGDPVGSLLLKRLSACEAVEGNSAFAGLLKSTWEQGRELRGPRLAAMYAAIETLGEIKKDRPKFPLDPQNVRAPYNNDLRDRFDRMTASVGVKFYGTEMTGSVVKSVKKTAKGVNVVFITEKFTVPAHICVDTNRIMRIDQNGNILYYRNCTFGKQMETITKHLEDALIPADLASNIAPGRFVEITRVDDLTLPLVVYADKSQKKQIAWRGFSL